MKLSTDDIQKMIKKSFSMEEVTPYLDQHRPDQQECISGVPINPNLRSGFDDTPNDARDALEVSDWWGRPFIVTESWEDNDETWEEFVERSKQFPSMSVGNESDFHASKAESKQSWFDTFPTGIRYQIRCLNGGAWDRSTLWGVVGSLDEAMKIIEQRTA